MKSIAIDGPSGAGKSTIARAVAKELGFIYVDTGALYRAVGFFAHQNGVSDNDETALAPRLGEIEIELLYKNGEQRVYLCGRDVSLDIRRPEMSMAASNVAAMPPVRSFLLDLQREMARRYNIVMDGRDIGTAVLPDADLKIFLTATAEDRARRRHQEFLQKGERISFDWVLEDMKKRDFNDKNRAASPLRQADGAILLDTTGKNLKESIALVLKTIKESGAL
jgi:cytidylate kinase